MTDWSGGLLNPRKAARVAAWLGEVQLVENLSWGLVDTIVLHVRSSRGDVIVKTAGASNHHIGREISAHESVTKCLVDAGFTAPMWHSDASLNLLVLEYQPGKLVQGSGRELSPDVHRQAGAILRLLHSVMPGVMDGSYVSNFISRGQRWLGAEHRIPATAVIAATHALEAVSPRTVQLVPTHGDWHARNWLTDGTQVKAIDFGRFAMRAASSDLCRLAVKEWRADPSLEDAFLDGYGDDPRDPELWRLELLCEAIGTAAWAYQVKDYEFEAQGHQQLSEALALF